MSGADSLFLLGDETASLLMRYSALIAQVNGGDAVRVNVLTGTGGASVVTLLLNSGTVLAAIGVDSVQREPSNTAADRYLQERLASYFAADANDPFSGPEGERAA